VGERNDLQDGAEYEADADEQEQTRHPGPLGEKVAEETESGDPAEDDEQRGGMRARFLSVDDGSSPCAGERPAPTVGQAAPRWQPAAFAAKRLDKAA
jgi:hypothetical protein